MVGLEGVAEWEGLCIVDTRRERRLIEVDCAGGIDIVILSVGVMIKESWRGDSKQQHRQETAHTSIGLRVLGEDELESETEVNFCKVSSPAASAVAMAATVRLKVSSAF